MADQTLSEALALLNITHKPSRVEGCRDWFDRDGKPLGTFDAAQGWAILKIMNDLGNAVGEAIQRYAEIHDAVGDRDTRATGTAGA